MMAIKEQLVEDIGRAYNDKTIRIVQSATLALGFMSSAVNVFIYTFKNKTLRKEWLKFICRPFKHERISKRFSQECVEGVVQSVADES